MLGVARSRRLADMPCCGGKKGGKPISRLQFAVGRVIFFGIRVTLAAGLGLAARVSPRFAPIARFWGLLSADWERAIARREGIVFHGDGHDAACPLAPHQRFQPFLIDGVEPRKRFVEDDQVGRVDDRADQLDHLRHALRHLADLFVDHFPLSFFH